MYRPVEPEITSVDEIENTPRSCRTCKHDDINQCAKVDDDHAFRPHDECICNEYKFWEWDGEYRAKSSRELARDNYHPCTDHRID